MTKAEYQHELDRLAKGWNVPITAQQVEAIFQRLGWAQVIDWQRAVDTVLASYLQPPRSGLLEILLKAVEEEGSHRRKQRVAKERAEAGRTWDGRVSDKYKSAEDHAYAQFRLDLLRGAMGRAPQAYALFHADGLAGWLEVPIHAEWARAQTIEGCGMHEGQHSLLSCLTAELAYWNARAVGVQTEEVATR